MVWIAIVWMLQNQCHSLIRIEWQLPTDQIPDWLINCLCNRPINWLTDLLSYASTVWSNYRLEILPYMSIIKEKILQFNLIYLSFKYKILMTEVFPFRLWTPRELHNMTFLSTLDWKVSFLLLCPYTDSWTWYLPFHLTHKSAYAVLGFSKRWVNWQLLSPISSA